MHLSHQPTAVLRRTNQISSIPGLCRAVMKVAAMVQDVAADQALMQLMDARGTLMELKVGMLLVFTH